MRSTWKMAVCAVMSVAVAACGGDDGDSGDSGLDQARVARIDQTPHGLDQARLARIGRTLRVRFVVVQNAPSDCPADVAFGSCFDAKLVLTNTAEAWSARGWKIDFSMIRKVISVGSGEFAIRHVNGDLHELAPTAQFAGFAAGETKEVPFKAEYWMISRSDIMPRYFVTAPGLHPVLIANTARQDPSAYEGAFASAQQVLRNGNDHVPQATAGTRFEANAETHDRGAAAVAAEVVPAPMSVTPGRGTLDLRGGVDLDAHCLSRETVAAVAARLRLFGVTTDGAVPVRVSVDAQAPAFAGRATTEAYTLRVDGRGVTIVGGDSAGAFYGLQTLIGLLPASGGVLPRVTIAYDAPRYRYRGVQLDLARNFHALAEVLAVLDQMAAYKLNTLHLHLSDDEGWRLEIPGLPELTTIGSRRCWDPTEKKCLLPELGSGADPSTAGTGHLSRAEFVEIVRAARARSIEVIPELDMPGHARAAIKAMQARTDATYSLSDPLDMSKYQSTQYYSDDAVNACMSSTYAFIDKVMTEVGKMYADAGATLKTWHVGGDEVGAGAWTASPACDALYSQGGDAEGGAVGGAWDVQAYFLRRVNALAKAHGFAIRGWSDNLKKVTGVDAMGNRTYGFLDPASDFGGNAVSTNWWGTLYWWDNSAYTLANMGYQVILTSPDFLYLDHPYEADPEERGYYWATRFTDVRKLFSYVSGNLPANAQLTKDRFGDDYTAAVASAGPLDAPANIIGLEGALWGETASSDEFLEQMVFPRMLALAERAWHRASWEPADGTQASATIDKVQLQADWERFANVLGHKELAKLDRAGVRYRVEVPGGQISDGKLQANVALPGLAIDYRDDHGHWVAYDDVHRPVVASTQVRARTASGRVGRAVAVP